MKIKNNILRLSFFFIIIIQNYRELLAYPIVQIKDCYDGDTCITKSGEKIRLACIDAPELKVKKVDSSKGVSSKNYLNNLVSNKYVEIKRLDIDRYGRTVAELFLNGKNIQKAIFDNQFAVIYKKYANQCKWSRN